MKQPILLLLLLLTTSTLFCQPGKFHLNDLEYFENQGVNVMAYQDIYPEGHQGGVAIIMHGMRMATNGDIRLDETPGQWQPIPKQKSRIVDPKTGLITVKLTYPDSSINRKGFNPIIYPELYFNYEVKIRTEGSSIIVSVDLDRPLPSEFIGKAGFNLELFPGWLFGKTWYVDQQTGIFPQQPNGPALFDKKNELVAAKPMATGKQIVIAPEDERLRLRIESKNGNLQLLDGRYKHNNGWFLLRSEIPAGATKNAIEWVLTPNAIPDWINEPVIHVSQIGYHPDQKKKAFIELDKKDTRREEVKLIRINSNGQKELALSQPAGEWGQFLRYIYLQLDFTNIKTPGIYQIGYGKQHSQPFRIDADVFDRHVWQPTLEYFLPVQMCHMRVNEQYRVWHGLCHMDDARMAPLDTNHFDGYLQGKETLTHYLPGEHVPGLNIGGWHDAGDYDLRVESQSGEVYILTQTYEAFNLQYDETSIDQQTRMVEIHQPDGKPDLLQQIEHGVLSVVNGYRSLGRLYRGIICPTLRQYVLLGDGVNMTDGLIHDSRLKPDEKTATHSAPTDDRWVFTENNPPRELTTAAHLAAASRVLKGFNDTLSVQCLEVAQAIYNLNPTASAWANSAKIHAATELFLTTKEQVYRDFLIQQEAAIVKGFNRLGWIIGPVLPLIGNEHFTQSVSEAAKKLSEEITKQGAETPFGVPYRPHIWGAGWDIQAFGVRQYFLHKAFPDIFPTDYLFNALNFILGVHPGSNTASFASGVGAKSTLVAYGVNRADWSYIPGGVSSGTALIRPDFPELLDWPYLWQQQEYVMGGGATNFMFLVLAANQLLFEKP
jgi:endoglucanase